MSSRQEIQHNTPEQALLYLQGALEIVETLDPPAELRETCFAKACDLLSAKQLVLMQPAPAVLPAMAIPGGH